MVKTAVQFILLFLGCCFAQQASLPKELPQFYGVYAVSDNRLFALQEAQLIGQDTSLGFMAFTFDVTGPVLPSSDVAFIIYSPDARLLCECPSRPSELLLHCSKGRPDSLRQHYGTLRQVPFEKG